MKSTLVILWLICFSITSYSGAPEQDPVISHIRGLQAKGHTPNMSDLKQGSRWKCLVRSSGYNVFKESYIYISFAKFDGLVKPTVWKGPKWSDEEAPYRWSTMAFTDDGLIGTQSTYRRVLLRIDKTNKDLLIELSTDEHQEDLSTHYPSAILSSDLKALFYFLCPQVQINSR